MSIKIGKLLDPDKTELYELPSNQDWSKWDQKEQEIIKEQKEAELKVENEKLWTPETPKRTYIFKKCK